MMLCPSCARPLHAVERQGIELDHCPDCGGFWLDRGELDRLVREEAMHALLQGQQHLHEERRSREYDQSAVQAATEIDFVGQYGNFGLARPTAKAITAE